MKEVAVMGLEDENGQPIIPKPDVPGSPLLVDEATTTEGEVTLGSELVGTRATFTGGEQPIDIETRWERSDDGLTWVTDSLDGKRCQFSPTLLSHKMMVSTLDSTPKQSMLRVLG